VAEVDRERWNRRYAERYAERDESWQPSRWLVEIEPWLERPFPGARALDLACGPGRHSIWLAERGWHVDAWDISDVALEVLGAEVERRAAMGDPLAVAPRQVDLDTVTIPARVYDLILNVYFLDRRLWPIIAKALLPGGLLASQTFLDVPGARASEVSPAHMLQPGEMRAAFDGLGLHTLLYDETGDPGTARLLARHP